MDRHARQARLAGVGPDGQACLARAHIDVPLDGVAADVAARYLVGAGVGRVRVRSAALAAGARAIDGRGLVEAEPSLPSWVEDVSAMGLQNAAAREIAAGALFALRALRRALQEGS